MSDTDDKSLEEFFAKKSKGKKTKSKAKAFTTTKDITEKQQQTKSTTEEKTEAAPKTGSEQVEEQWKDFEAPTEADYTGLRIQSLQIEEEKDKEEEKEQNEYDGEGNLLGEDQVQGESASGVWSKSNPQPSGPAAPIQPEIVSRPTGRYIPGAFNEKYRRGRTGVAPDIGSQAAFPSLSAAASDTGKGRADFEMVKHGMRSSKDSGATSHSSVHLGNRYDSLRS